MERGWERRAEPPELSQEEICERLRGYAGRRPVRGSQVLSGGLVNVNLRVQLAEPDEYVVLRIHLRPEDVNVAEKEAAVLRALPAGVPAPRVLHTGQLAGRAHAVHTLLPGSALSTLLEQAGHTEVGAAALQRAGHELGRALASLHAAPRTAFGFLDGRLQVSAPGPLPEVWRSYLRAALRTGRAGTRLSDEERGRLLAFAEQGAARLEGLSDTNVLLHGDCKPTNVFVHSDGALAGLLDWEFAFSGPALFDLGQMLRWPTPPVYEQALFEGYLAAGARLPEDWRTLARMLDLVNLVGFLEMDGERPTVFRDARRMISETLAVLVLDRT